MRVVKVAYTRQWIRRRRKCAACGVIWTSRERFDGAVMDAQRRLVPEGRAVAGDKKPRVRRASVQPHARGPLDEMVWRHYADRAGRVQEREGSDGGGAMTDERIRAEVRAEQQSRGAAA